MAKHHSAKCNEEASLRAEGRLEEADAAHKQCVTGCNCPNHDETQD